MNHRLDHDPPPTHRKSPPLHRARPRSTPTTGRTRRSRTVLSVLASAVLVVPTALAVTGSSGAAAHAGTAGSNATGCVRTVNGIPPKGHAYVGAAAGGRQSYAGLQSKAGLRLREHRAYFSAGQVKGAVRVVKADLAAKRLPWISFQVPSSWGAMANGRGDAWARDLTKRLAAVHGPVWIAFDHEPIESGRGPVQQWVRMQRHLAPIVHAHSNNIAYSVIYSSWNVTFGKSRLAKVWPGAGIDILGIDIYNSFGVRSHRMTNPMKFIPIFRSWADSHGARWAIAESAYTQRAANVDPRWLDKMFNDAVTNGAAAYTYFDSSKNSVADWTLDTPTRLAAFKRILSRSTRLC
jgi:hypothetical protein